MDQYDIIIVGAGPIGLVVAIEAQKAGLNYLVIEKGSLTDSLFHFPVNMTFFSTSVRLEIGGVPFISHSDKPTRREALEYYRRVADSWALNIQFYEEVEHLEPHIIEEHRGHILHTSKKTYYTKNVVLATGFYGKPRLLHVPGEELSKVRHYYTEAHPYIGQKILVVGAANSACDLALELYHKGAEVQMVIRKAALNPRVKYWIKPNIENRIKEGSITAYFNSTISKITENTVEIQSPEGKKTISNDFVLAMTGYQPDYDFLTRMGVQFEADEGQSPILDPETLATPTPGLYLAGVVAAGLHTSKLFIENTRHHGQIILEDILAKKGQLLEKA
ncbi:MAG: YpdA family putative bacillithiol disulfide reductase [Bacteroidota bacterium]